MVGSNFGYRSGTVNEQQTTQLEAPLDEILVILWDILAPEYLVEF